LAKLHAITAHPLPDPFLDSKKKNDQLSVVNAMVERFPKTPDFFDDSQPGLRHQFESAMSMGSGSRQQVGDNVQFFGHFV